MAVNATDRIPSRLRVRAFAWHQFVLTLTAAIAVLVVLGAMAIPILRAL